jgi:hypothetical protein
MKGLERGEIAFEFRLNHGPGDPFVAMHVLLEARLQFLNQIITFCCLHSAFDVVMSGGFG